MAQEGRLTADKFGYNTPIVPLIRSGRKHNNIINHLGPSIFTSGFLEATNGETLFNKIGKQILPGRKLH